MSTISTALRDFKEPTKEQITQNFFSLASLPAAIGKDAREADDEVEKMDINAVLSLGVEGEEDSYVGCTALVVLDIALITTV